MPQLTHRDYAGGADRDAALALWLSARAAGQGDPWPALHTLHTALGEAARAPGRAHLWTDCYGDLIAAALLLEESVLVWAVRPGADDEAVEAAIIGWGLARAAGAGLFVPVRDDDWRLAALLERIGFQEENWRMLRLERSLLAPIAPPCPPAGGQIRPLDASRELAAVTRLHSAIFAGGDKRVAERRKLMAAPGYRPALDLVAVTSAGDLAGYCFGTVCALERRMLAWAPGWLELIGVAEPWRGQGLGQALTLAMLAALRAEGLVSVLLSVSATNTTARSLFERCGFRTRHSIRWYLATGEPARAYGTLNARTALAHP
jgi:mycothiol synthase